MDGCTSSPVRRCIQTAELIAAGNRFHGSVDTSPSLGGSSLFIDDDEALEHTLDTCTIEEIIGRQLEGRKVPGMRDLEEGLRVFMGRVLSDRSREFEVFVSHDLFVCPAVHYLTETYYSSAGNTGFLEGFFIALDGDRTMILWNPIGMTSPIGSFRCLRNGRELRRVRRPLLPPFHLHLSYYHPIASAAIDIGMAMTNGSMTCHGIAQDRICSGQELADAHGLRFLRCARTAVQKNQAAPPEDQACLCPDQGRPVLENRARA